MTRQLWCSDLHFLHNNICKFTDRPWTPEENTEKLIEIWNENVNPGDVCWHLGDFTFAKGNARGIQQTNEILDRLNGQKRLILGNHDPSRMWEKLFESRDDIVSVDKLKEISIGIKPNKIKVVMCHYALVHWNQSHRGAIQLHGHSHGAFFNRGRSIDVGLDGSMERLGERRFWTEEDVMRVGLSLEPFIPEEHKKHRA